MIEGSDGKQAASMTAVQLLHVQALMTCKEQWDPHLMVKKRMHLQSVPHPSSSSC
jgi:hypothetical protein